MWCKYEGFSLPTTRFSLLATGIDIKPRGVVGQPRYRLHHTTATSTKFHKYITNNRIELYCWTKNISHFKLFYYLFCFYRESRVRKWSETWVYRNLSEDWWPRALTMLHDIVRVSLRASKYVRSLALFDAIRCVRHDPAVPLTFPQSRCNYIIHFH